MIQLSLITPQLKANILLYSKNDTKKSYPQNINKHKDFETKVVVTKEETLRGGEDKNGHWDWHTHSIENW